MNETLIITNSNAGHRLDVAVSSAFEQYSRVQIQKLIVDNKVYVNQVCISNKRHIVSENDVIDFQVTPIKKCEDKPQKMDLDIAYEDEDLFVINKCANLVVHPGAGMPDSTLLNAIIERYPENRQLPQAGLIHRLDKNTTGLLLIAKNSHSYLKLNQAMAKREIHRHYIALVQGIVHKSATIDAPLARHPKYRTKYSVNPNGRHAITHYQVIERFKHHTLLKVTLETGRTHQIRVHMHHINYPVVGDPVYNRYRSPKKNELSDTALQVLSEFKRQALHATELGFIQPLTLKPILVTIPLPDDFETLLNAIRP
jgi:23S rRNA pseudouridine1911/1915/1917 synthase